MRFLTRLFKHTLLYKIYLTLSSFVYYQRVKNTVYDILHGNQFKSLLKEYLNLDVDTDWLGRLYGVINPNIDIDGKFTINNTILEINGANTNDEEYLKVWIYRQLQIIGDIFKMNNLYDYISLDVEHVGPITHDNFLLVFDLVARENFAYNFKRMLKHLTTYIIIAFVCIMTIIKFWPNLLAIT